jgi:sugar lactone lactonase YvrE
VALDGAGNLFVADTRNHTVRKITPAGAVTTLAGSADSHGSVDGVGGAARFGAPYSVAVDGSGNVYVADQNFFTIRKITSAGVVTTLAGMAGSLGTEDGTGADARFYFPEGVAVDEAGNVYVADTSNRTIRKITPAGVVTTLAGAPRQSGSADGTGTAARFASPWGLAVDRAGQIFVADGYTIRMVTSAGAVTTVAGKVFSPGSADGTGAEARFDSPGGVAVDGMGNLFVADSGNATIRKITTTRAVSTLAGKACPAGRVDGTGAEARFDEPYSLAVDRAGNVFVADLRGAAIRKITPAGVVTTFSGTGWGSVDGSVADIRFPFPGAVAVDGEGNLFVADTVLHTVQKISTAGVVTTLAGTAGLRGSIDGTGADARFGGPTALALDEAGNLFVADENTIRRITSAGVVTTLAGTAGLEGSADGTGQAARFSGLSGVAVDRAGNLFVTDSGNNTIRRITPTGVVTTLAGSADSPSGSVDGTGPDARFDYPGDLAEDGAGNIFVADTNNNAIRKVTTAGVVTTVVGALPPLSKGNFPGPLPASISSPHGIAVDRSTGNLYISLSNAVMAAVFGK